MTRWVIEEGVFGQDALTRRARERGLTVHAWEASWWERAPDWSGDVYFRGSLGFAARVERELSWRPGAMCEEAAFSCAAWYPRVTAHLLTERHVFTTVEALCDDPEGVAAQLDAQDTLFVRPDSPLKPFSGRVVSAPGLTPGHLDHGFYYEDLTLAVVATPVVEVHEEWRFVVVEGVVVAESGYVAEGRAERAGVPEDARALACEIAGQLEPPARAYVLDVARTGAGLGLVELNPFGGADLYGCDPDAVLDALC